MTKVITYGTYDLIHYGHIRLLERAKALGDYLIVGVTAEDFDKVRGKINVKQSLMERVENVRATGLADEIIIEEYEGQKIDDIKKYDIDIFTVGSDWVGKFDYLDKYCKVVYLERTEGISSSDVRSKENEIRFGVIGRNRMTSKVVKESQFVNGLDLKAIFTDKIELFEDKYKDIVCDKELDSFLESVDAVYIGSNPSQHYKQIKKALECGKHVLFETPIAFEKKQAEELLDYAKQKNLILMESIKTAYSTAYNRMLLQLKTGKIGDIVSVDATCTSLLEFDKNGKIDMLDNHNSVYEWGPTCILPILQILGSDYKEKKIITRLLDYENEGKFDIFTKIDFIYSGAVASLKVGTGVKSEGELIVSGTKGYIYIPAPWWKTDYFEIRYENPADNRRFFYQLDGEGIRYELVAFAKAISVGKIKYFSNISDEMTIAISKIIEDFDNGINVEYI